MHGQTPRCRSLQHLLSVPASGRVLVGLVFYTGGASITHRPQKRQAPSIVKIRDVIKMLEDDGWSVVRQRVRIDSSSMHRILVSSRLRANLAMISRQEPSTVS